ncbi:hypothetical protein [Amycolatopsis taiwanensis]|uniref:Uncharacterized protein n=1 Tax=Amycolatopsis taiwanensis TaxID=342230 RepID=A0A9W6VEZ9_9PSEU|nr:hypothetical protein [Amycolatopsis taiwanensis]GLY64011.1 hypothetical protein Atai01_06300 [Amycolatopsis taiwanensis]
MNVRTPRGATPEGALGEQIGAWTPTTYAGLATFDACAILSLAELEKAGFEADPNNEYHDQHFTANAIEPQAEHYGLMDGAGTCQAYMKGQNLLDLNISRFRCRARTTEIGIYATRGSRRYRRRPGTASRSLPPNLAGRMQLC